MPEFHVPPLKTVAMSEPLWLDGAIYAALETPARDAIGVWLNPHNLEGEREIVRIHVGGETDNGVRAQWPRLAVGADDVPICAYQRGAEIAFDNVGTAFPVYGIWPISVKNVEPVEGWDGTFYRVAPPTTSQGMFGFLDGRWWTFDEVWQSQFALAYPKGVLFHGWRHEGVLHLLFKDNDGVVLCTDANATWNRFRVFEGHAEYPRGCSTPNGVYVHAVAADGQYRAALEPFTRLSEPPMEPSPMPAPLAQIHAFENEVTAPDHVFIAVECSGTAAFIRWRPTMRDEQEWNRREIPLGKVGVRLILDPGVWDISALAMAPGSEPAITTVRRTVTVLPVPVPPVKPTQVVTSEDMDALVRGMQVPSHVWGVLTGWEREGDLDRDARAHYVTLRCAGQDHVTALAAVRAEAWSFVEAEIQKAKEA